MHDPAHFSIEFGKKHISYTSSQLIVKSFLKFDLDAFAYKKIKNKIHKTK